MFTTHPAPRFYTLFVSSVTGPKTGCLKKNLQNELYRNFLKCTFKLDKMGCARKNSDIQTRQIIEITGLSGLFLLFGRVDLKSGM